MKTKLLLFVLFFSIIINAQTNLVPNGGFETWTNSTTLSSWTTANNVIQNTSSYTEGSKSVQLSIANNTAKPEITVQVPMTTGKTYTVKFKYKYVNANYNGQHPISLNISKNGSATTLSSSTFATDNNWTVKETTFTPDQNLSYDLSISLYTFDAAAFNVLIDDVQVYIQGTEQYTLIPDVNFEKKLIALGIDFGSTDGKVLTNSVNKLTSLNVSSSSITDLTGIQDFVALQFLQCYNNKLTTLDVSKNVNLTSLNFDSNQLTTIDIAANIALTNLTCSSNQITNLDVSKNLSLTYLYCNYNQISLLDVSKNLGLKSLDCYSNKLTALDVTQNTALTNLTCAYNQITTLDFSKNVGLTYIFCSSNKLTTIDVSNNVALTTLMCYSNQLISLDVSKNIQLERLECEYNKLKTLDVSKNLKLQKLECWDNELTNLNVSKNLLLSLLKCRNNLITSLDLSKNTALTFIDCSSNRTLNDLNLQNGKNSLLNTSSLDLKNNPSLACVLVDDVVFSNTNWTSSKDISVNYTLTCTTPQYTLIPDVEFEKKLIDNGVDGVLDGKVLTATIVVKEYLNLDSSQITDLTGLQDFIALKTLYCSSIGKITNLDISKNTQLSTLTCGNNNLTTLDISKNLALKSLYINGNKLASIDVSKNLALENLSCQTNQLTSLDVSKNLLLTTLYCYSNQIADLDVSKNLKLTQLECSSNKLAVLDVSNSTALTKLNCNSNKLTNLNISKNINLKDLTCSYNQLTTFDVTKNTLLTSLDCYLNKIVSLDVSKNPTLKKLICSENKLTTLDVSYNPLLESLWCHTNILKYLDVSKNKALLELQCGSNQLKSANFKNGNNMNVTSVSFKNNPYLSCIQVDDIAYSNTNWATKKDATAGFSSDCAYSTAIPDPKFEDKLIALGIDNDGKNGKVLTANITDLSSLDVSNVGIEDLTGIEDFTALQSLSCNNNSLTKIDLSKNIYLASLNIAANKLTMLNVVNNTKLQTIHCNDNLLKTLDFSKNTSLTEIYCPNNKLISLNLKNGNNAINNGPSIKNFTSNPDLSCIQVDDVTYSNTNWSLYKDAAANYSSDCAYSTAIPDAKFEDKLIALGIDTDGKNGKVLTGSIASITSLDVSSSSITDLTGIQDFEALTSLICYGNQLTVLDVSKNTALTTLNCHTNQLTLIDLSKNLGLIKLYCSNNNLTALDVSKNTALTIISCHTNKLTSMDVSKNKELTAFYADTNNLTALDVSNNTALTILYCSYNNLQTLNLKNGKNTLLTNSNIFLYGNSNLYCILVDDVTFSNNNWANRKDATATFNSVECKALSLPVNNFNVESKGETCLNSNNGEINITATATYTYKASINGTPYSFTNNSLKVSNLTPGTYTVSITISGEPFEQSFRIVIPKGATITGKSSVVANKVAVEITEGTAPYSVFVDGVEQFETTDSNFTVETKKGGLLQVKTAKACEGIYSKDIARLEGVLSAYPNPTPGSFEIELPTTKKEVVVTLYTLEGQTISTKTYTVENGKVQLSLENQPAGVYVAKIELDTPDYLKIIKN
jgi:Leucine-rich repeat (LRR) protein